MIAKNVKNVFTRTILVTGNNSWVTSKALAIFYQTLNGEWRMLVQIYGTHASVTNVAVVIHGVTFSSDMTYQYLTAGSQSTDQTCVKLDAGTNSVGIYSVAHTGTGFSGDVGLASKPTMYLGE